MSTLWLRRLSPGHFKGILLLFGALSVCTVAGPVAHAGSYKVYSTYLWHLQQPIYWPEKISGQNRYQFAYDSLGGSTDYPGHPENNLADIFGKDDRKAVYQYRTRDAVAVMGQPDAGAQISYSGCLIENVRSLGDNYSLGYNPSWNAAIREAMGWTTTRGKRKLEPVGFTYHHAIAPLIDKDALRKEIAINKEIWWKAWNGNSDKSDHPKGFRCAEESFSLRIIKELVEAGYEWVVVPNHHLSRTHPNYTPLHGNGRYDPPNKADQINPPNHTGAWYSGDDTGRGSTESIPFSFRAHRAKYVDPESGAEYKIIVVPMTDLGSWKDGFNPQGLDLLHQLNTYSTYDHPCLALFCHDGDNAWGGGFSYYMEAIPNYVNAAAASGYRPTTIQTFLDENPPPPDDIVHVEDGSWFNAESDWGHPLFINWLWPPQRDRASPEYDETDPATFADIHNGWAEDYRNWAVLVAAQNYVSTAEQVHRDGGGSFDNWKVQEPVAPDGTDWGANDAEKAWQFFLPALTSGYMYYGKAIDMEVKQSLACNQAIVYAQNVLNAHAPMDDQTGPSVFIPQRYPYNPGSLNYGPNTRYIEWTAPSDFDIWTFAFDVSGVTSVVLKVRVDNDTFNPLDNNDNETYAGGPSVGSWIDYPMIRRDGNSFKGNFFNDPEINFFIMPTAIADAYGYRVTGFNNVLLDYYIEAFDSHGHVKKTDIQHVFIGTEGGGTPVVFSPTAPEDCDELVTTYYPLGRPLAGASNVTMTITFNNWTSSNDYPMSPLVNGGWVHTNAIPLGATDAQAFFHDGDGTIDNNEGSDWSVPISPCSVSASPSVSITPSAPDGCEEVTITYYPGSDGPLKDANPVYIHIGRNNWQDVVTNNTAMTASGTNWTYVYSPPPGTIQINCVFHNQAGIWDNNNDNDWAVDVENCSGGVTQGIAFARGTPEISADPISDQNHPGDNFDLNPEGGDAVTVDQGGFGSFGHVYVNYDDTNFYIGGIGCSIVDSNNAMMIFLDFNTLTDNKDVLWDQNGLPEGLDRLHNVAFNPPMDIAILLGDEYGDDTFPSYMLGAGDEFGQGVFYLSATSFTAVANARISQFDGAATIPTGSGDDDGGDRLTDRWEVSIPWARLGAADISSLTSCHVAGLLTSSSVSGNDRYLSGNYLGLTATNDAPRDAFGNFAFTFVTLTGLRVQLPDHDRDGDGLPDDWEDRFFGGVTNAVVSEDSDTDGLTNGEEYLLGTHPLSGASVFQLIEVDYSGPHPGITWKTVGGKTYQVMYSDDLVLQTFSDLAQVMETDVPDGVESTEAYTDDFSVSGQPAGGIRYYRVRLVTP